MYLIQYRISVSFLGNFATTVLSHHELHGKFLEALVSRDESPDLSSCGYEAFKGVTLETSGAFAIIRIPLQQEEFPASDVEGGKRVWLRLHRRLTGCLSEPPLPLEVYPHQDGERFCFCKVSWCFVLLILSNLCSCYRC